MDATPNDALDPDALIEPQAPGDVSPAERSAEEGFGDFYQRLMGLRAQRTSVTGRELPTIDLIPQEVAR